MKRSLLSAVWPILFFSCYTGTVYCREVSPEPSVLKIACIGASITYGATLPHPETQAYPQQLQKLLGARYKVINYGVSSATMLRKGDLSYWNTPAYQAALRSQPDIVTIDLGGNDAKLINRIHLPEFWQDARDLVFSFSRTGHHPRVILLLPFPSYDKDTTGIYDRVIIADIIPLLRRLAQEEHLEVADMHTPFEDKEGWMPDKIHPNEQGAALAATILSKLITGSGEVITDGSGAGNGTAVAALPPGATYFAPDFAPSGALTTPVERPFRDDTCLNGSWKFLPVGVPPNPDRRMLENPELPSHPEWDPVALRIPSPWNINSFAGGREGGDFVTYPDYPAGWDTVKAGWLKRTLPYKKSWEGSRIILHFEAVAGYTRIYVNGKPVGEHFDNFMPFDIDVTDEIRKTGDNELLVWVAAGRLFEERGQYGRRTYVGGSFWGQHINGIWQDVTLLVRPAVYISNIFIHPLVGKDSLGMGVRIRNTSGKQIPIRLSGAVFPWINEAGKSVTEAPEPRWRLGKEVMTLKGPNMQLSAHSDTTLYFSAAVHGSLSLWSPAQPDLYGLVLRLNSGRSGVGASEAGGGTKRTGAGPAGAGTTDAAYTRFGWREATVRGKQFLLNGQPLVLKGDSWHFMGIPQMTRRYAWAWYTMLKETHANAVRLHAQPYPSFYLDVADEMGIMVLDETAMWASDGGPKINSEEYWTHAARHLRELITRDRNHPSVFGWSVCNENIPVAVNVFHAPDSLVQRQLSEINRWVTITREMDPTRNWISGDGETGKPTNLPTTIGHYGGERGFKDWSSGSQLWGIGESGMAYYGTPRQTAAYNGDISYTSQWQRMEGVAIEATHLTNLMKKYQASYMSVFNLVWYGLQPLELGLTDTTRASMPADGIFFHPFREGRPGVQPERLGPYTSTLNPGYDPRLPLYKPWPLLTALAAAFADTGQIAELPTPAGGEANGGGKSAGAGTGAGVAGAAGPDAGEGGGVARLLSSDKGGVLDSLLHALGVSLSDNGDILIIDGIHPPSGERLAAARATAQKGGSVLIWGIRPNTVTLFNTWLPASLTVTARKASSYIPDGNSSLTKGLDNAAFYFSELSRQPVSEYGLSGDFVQRGKVLLTDCNTDWQRWNNRPEYSKTITLIRSERESKSAGNVLAEIAEGRGRIDILAIDPLILARTSEKTTRRLLANLGLRFADNVEDRNAAIDATGVLRQAMVSRAGGSEGGSGGAVRNVIGADFKAPARISFWIYSPRSLVNLLAEPDIPVVDLTVSGSRSWKLFINDSLAGKSPAARTLPLLRGWNHLVIDISKGDNPPFLLKLECNNPLFISSLRSSIDRKDKESSSTF